VPLVLHLALCGTLYGWSLEPLIDALRSLIAELEEDGSLEQPDRVRSRLEALDRLEACILFGDSSQAGAECGEGEIYRRAKALYSKLERINFDLYEAMRNEIQRGAGHALLDRAIAESGPGLGAAGGVNAESYDYLDELVSGVLRLQDPKARTVELDEEMVHYQPTPARHIFDFVSRIGLCDRDMLVDFGSGLGHVPLLAGICSGARCIGIELEAALVACARQCAGELKLSHVTFIEQDARGVDLRSGTVFYLYTPFTGTILRAVLDSLRKEAASREFRVCTFGPCTGIVAGEPWLERDRVLEGSGVAVFRSRI
jgi:hypothetical protein